MPFAPRRTQSFAYRAPPHRHSTVERGYDWRWRRDSKRWLRSEVARTGNPWCRLCKAALATEVDHVIAPSSRYEPGTDEHRAMHRDEGNWQPVCKPCNSRKGSREVVIGD